MHSNPIDGGVATRPAASARIRRWSVHLTGWMIILAGMFVALNLLLVLFRIHPRPAPWDPNVPDAVLGMRPTPGLSVKADFPEYKGTVYLRTNRQSFYELDDTSPEPAPGIIRIVAMGDSHTVGACNVEESFPNLWESYLNARAGGQRYEVINAGVGRYSPYQNFVRARSEILKLKPRHIVVAQYVGNDFLDLIRQDDRPYLERQADGSFLERPPVFVAYQDPNRRPGWLASTRLVTVLESLLSPNLMYQFSRVRIIYSNLSLAGHSAGEIASYLRNVQQLDRISHGLMLQSLHQQVWFDRFPETLPVALEASRWTMKAFRDLCNASHIRLTYLILPTKPTIEPNNLSDTFARIAGVDSKWTLNRVAEFDNRLADESLQAAHQLGIEVVDARPAMREASKDGELLFYHEDSHTAVPGNRAIAGSLAGNLGEPGVPGIP